MMVLMDHGSRKGIFEDLQYHKSNQNSVQSIFDNNRKITNNKFYSNAIGKLIAKNFLKEIAVDLDHLLSAEEFNGLKFWRDGGL